MVYKLFDAGVGQLNLQESPFFIADMWQTCASTLDGKPDTEVRIPRLGAQPGMVMMDD